MPFRIRLQAATSVGTCAWMRTAFRRFASRELSPASGSYTPRAETAVRRTSIESDFRGRLRTSVRTLAGSRRWVARAFRRLSSSARLGSAPFQSSATVSSNEECATRSWMS